MSLSLKSKSKHLIIFLNSLVPSNTWINVYTHEAIYDTFFAACVHVVYFFVAQGHDHTYPLQMEKKLVCTCYSKALRKACDQDTCPSYKFFSIKDN